MRDLATWVLLGGVGILLLAAVGFIFLIVSDHRQRSGRLDR
jgi:hypothetical protein